MSRDDPDKPDPLEEEMSRFRACMFVIWLCLAVLAAIYTAATFLKAIHHD